MDHRASLQMPAAMSSTIGFNSVGSINQNIQIIACPLNTLVNTGQLQNILKTATFMFKLWPILEDSWKKFHVNHYIKTVNFCVLRFSN